MPVTSLIPSQICAKAYQNLFSSRAAFVVLSLPAFLCFGQIGKVLFAIIDAQRLGLKVLSYTPDIPTGLRTPRAVKV